MRAYHAGIFPKSDQAAACFIGEHLVIDQADTFFQDDLQHPAVVALLLDGVGEKEISLPPDQHTGWYFFDAHEDIAIRQIFLQADALALIGLIRKTADERWLNDNLEGVFARNFDALLRGKGYAGIWWYLPFADNADFHGLMFVD